MQISTRLKLNYKNSKNAKPLEQLIFDVTKLILNNTPENLHERILNKVENLNFDIHEMGESSEYVDSNNTVFINLNHIDDPNVYLHEVMHAVGTEKNFNILNIGLNQRLNLKINKDNNLLINMGYGANEGLNQHYTENFIKSYAQVSQVSPEYSYLANLMSNLEKLFEFDELKDAHFSGKGIMHLIHLVVKNCNLPNDNKILKFILQLDAFSTIARTHIVFGATYCPDMRYALIASYKTLITLGLMKAKQSNKDILFTDLITFEHLENDNLAYFNKQVLNELIKYFYLEKQHIFNEKLSNFEGLTYKSALKNMYLVFSNYINNLKIDGNLIPEQLKCGEFYNYLLLNNVIADENNESKLIYTSDFQKDFTVAIFNEKNAMLPKSKSEMAQLITQILTSRTVVRCGAEIDDKFIYQATENENFNKYLMETMPNYYTDNFDNISYCAKANVNLVEKMLEEVFLNRMQLYKFKKMMPKELLERQDIKQLLEKYKVDEKISNNIKHEK